MSDPPTLVPTLPECFDGFRLELDPERQRADVILDRPPLNIVTMAEREQLRAVFEALDADARIRVVVLRAAGEHFSSGGEISGFLDASPEHVSRLAWNIGALPQAGDRRQPRILLRRRFRIGAGLRFPHRLRDLPLFPARAASRTDPRIGRRCAAAKNDRRHPSQGHRHALAARSRPPGP